MENVGQTKKVIIDCSLPPSPSPSHAITSSSASSFSPYPRASSLPPILPPSRLLLLRIKDLCLQHWGGRKRVGVRGKEVGSGDVLKRLDVLACHNIPELQTGREHVSADAYSGREKECEEED